MKLNKNSYAFIFAVVFGICWIPPTAFSEDKHMDHGSMDHGSMDHSSSPVSSGDEYRIKPDEMDHSHMEHGKSDGSIFRTQGAHDDMGMTKPENPVSYTHLTLPTNREV